MLNNIVEDRNDQYELAKNHGILIGSFTNPEAAKAISGEGSQVFKSTEADFEESIKIVERGANNIDDKSKRKRKRKILK